MYIQAITKRIFFVSLTLVLSWRISLSQTAEHQIAKIYHAEPLYVDLIRDLGARKGEREINIAAGMVDDHDRFTQNYLIEYEFAPVNRLGLEIEVPITFSTLRVTSNDKPGKEIRNGVEGIKGALQYSFLISSRFQMTLAAGYLIEAGNLPTLHNPFLIIAKRWGHHFHSLIYTGPVYTQTTLQSFDVNFNVHYVLSATRNFVGMEINMRTGPTREIALHPQMKLSLSPLSSVGFVAGVGHTDKGEHVEFLIRVIRELPEKN